MKNMFTKSSERPAGFSESEVFNQSGDSFLCSSKRASRLIIFVSPKFVEYAGNETPFL